MINGIRESNTAPRLRDKPRQTARPFSRWYDQNHANDQSDLAFSEKLVIKPHSLTSMEDILFLASQEDESPSDKKNQVNPYRRSVLNTHISTKENGHQYVFEFMCMPLKSERSFPQD